MISMLLIHCTPSVAVTFKRSSTTYTLDGSVKHDGQFFMKDGWDIKPLTPMDVRIYIEYTLPLIKCC